MSSGIILYKYAGKKIPNGYLELALIDHRACIGAVAVDKDEKGLTKLDISRETALLSREKLLENINAAQDVFEDQACVFFIGKGSAKFLEDDVQPFTLFEDHRGQKVVMFAEGDYNNFNQKSSAHTDEFFLYGSYLLPFLKEKFDNSKNSVKDFMDSLRSSVVKTTFDMTSTGRGHICIVADTGEVLTIAKNDKMRQYSWGVVSQHLDFEEEDTPVKTVDDAVNSGEGLFAGKINKKKIITATDVTNGMGEAKEAPSTEETSTKNKLENLPFDTAKLDEHHTVMFPPERVRGSNKRVKAWYRNNTIDGTCPSDWKEWPPAVVRKGTDGIPFNTKTDTAVSVKESAPAFSKDTMAKHIKAENVKPAEPEKEKPADDKPSEFPLVVPAEEKKTAAEMLSKHIAVSPQIPNLTDILEYEKKLPTFTENVGLRSISDTFGWNDEILLDLVKRCPKLAVSLIKQYRINLMPLLINKEPPKEEPVIETEETARPITEPSEVNKTSEQSSARKKKVIMAA